MCLITKPALKTKDEVADITDVEEKWILERERERDQRERVQTEEERKSTRMQESDVQIKYEKGHKRLNLGNNNEMAAKKCSRRTTEFKND